MLFCTQSLNLALKVNEVKVVVKMSVEFFEKLKAKYKKARKNQAFIIIQCCLKVLV